MQEFAKQKGVDACHLLFEECLRGKKSCQSITEPKTVKCFDELCEEAMMF